jgi:hypothetical protein
MASQIMAEKPKPVALMPSPGQGETAENPRPKPNISKIRDSAAVATAPAKMALQETPDFEVAGLRLVT